MEDKLFNSFMSKVFSLYVEDPEEFEVRTSDDRTAYLYCVKYIEPVCIAERSEHGQWKLFLVDVFGSLVDVQYFEEFSFFNNFFETIYKERLNICDDEVDDIIDDDIDADIDDVVNETSEDLEKECSEKNIQIQVNKVINKK